MVLTPRTLRPAVTVVGADALLPDKDVAVGLAEAQALGAQTAWQKAQEAGERKRRTLLRRVGGGGQSKGAVRLAARAQYASQHGRWVGERDRRPRLRPQSATLKLPGAKPEMAGKPRAGSAAPGDRSWFEVGQTRTHSGSWNSWYTPATVDGPPGRAAVFHRNRPATAGAARTATDDGAEQSAAPPRPHSAGAAAVAPEMSAGSMDETGGWKPREEKDAVLTATVKATSGVEARGAQTKMAERPSSAVVQLQNKPLRNIGSAPPRLAAAERLGEWKEAEVRQWLGVAQLTSDVQQAVEAERAVSPPPQPKARPASAGPAVPMHVIEADCVAGSTSGARGLPHRPWSRQESWSPAAQGMPTDGYELRSEDERVDEQRAQLLAKLVGRAPGSPPPARGLPVEIAPRRSYDSGVGYRSLLRPTDRADGRATWGLLEPDRRHAPEQTGGARTTWQS